MSVLLVIDDEASIQHAFRRAFASAELEVVTAGAATEGLRLASERDPDVVIVDVGLPDMSGLELFKKLRKTNAKVPVVFVTGHATTETAIEATKLGAFDYLFKPLELDALQDVVTTALEVSRLQRVPAVLDGERDDRPVEKDVMVGQCPAMQEVYKAVGRVAQQDVTVLISGESGTGKELVARAIYHHSGRAGQPFLAVNCAAIPETLLESEIFGHEKGAFTDAHRQQVGKFEQVNGGTLFLDEIGEMSAMTQAKLLRVLADQKFQRLGGSEVVTTDVRLIAATNTDLSARVTSGDFRADLYYRLGVFTIHLPPLRDRSGDLLRLTDHFVRLFARELGKEVRDVAPTTRQVLEGYDWPGNIRELQSVLKHAILHSSGPVLLPDFLPDTVRDPAGVRTSKRSTGPEGWSAILDDLLQKGDGRIFAQWQQLTERYLLERVMQYTGGNLSHAARLLSINRHTLRTHLRDHGIHPGGVAGS